MRILRMTRVCFLNVLDGHGVDDSGVSGTGHNGIVWHISIRVMLVLAWSYWDHSQTIMIMIIMIIMIILYMV